MPKKKVFIALATLAVLIVGFSVFGSSRFFKGDFTAYDARDGKGTGAIARVTQAECDFIAQIWDAGDWTARFEDDRIPGYCASRFSEDWSRETSAEAIEQTCRAYNNQWTFGGWTARNGGLYEMTHCRELYSVWNWESGGDGLTFDQCDAYKTEFNTTDWTERYGGDMSIPSFCDGAYHALWNGIGDTAWEDRCEAVKDLWNVGGWSSRFGSEKDDDFDACRNYGRFDWNFYFHAGPSYYECEEVKTIFDTTDWTGTFGDTDVPSFCANVFPSIWLGDSGSGPSEARCSNLLDAWNLGGWTARYGSELDDEFNYCKNTYDWFRDGWDRSPGSGPSHARCQEVRNIWNEGGWTARYGDSFEPEFCADVYPDVWNGVSGPRAGYEEIIEDDEFANPFTDVNESSLEGRAAINLYYRAIIGGYPDGEFKGARIVNRAEAAKFVVLSLVNAGKLSLEDVMNKPYDARFPDVKEGRWYVPFIMTALDEDIVAGNPDGTFAPGREVNTVELLRMVRKAFGINTDYLANPLYSDVDPSDWYFEDAKLASAYQMFPLRSRELFPGRELPRYDTAVGLYQFLNRY